MSIIKISAGHQSAAAGKVKEAVLAKLQSVPGHFWEIGQFRAELIYLNDGNSRAELYQVVEGKRILIAEGTYPTEEEALHHLLVTLAEYINKWGC